MKGDVARALADDFFERCGFEGSTFRDGPSGPPLASVNFGAAGIAYAMYRIAVARGDDRLLALATAWCERAAAFATQRDAFLGGRLAASLFHSRSGVHAVEALVAVARGDAERGAAAASDFVAASRVACEYDDLTLGRAGLLVGCAELLEAMKGSGVDSAAVHARGVELRDDIARKVEESAFATSTSMSFLGLAHGWAGLLFALLRFSQACGESAEIYRANVDELASLQEPLGKGIRFPEKNCTVSPSTYVPSWCHGVAGHALLWALAHDVFGEGEYGVLAERCAESAWAWSVELGTLCCGLAGIAYACAAAHRVTGNAAWLARARLSARFAAEDRSSEFHRDSLYNGGVGVVLVSAELDAGTAAAPFVERVRREP